MTFSGIFTFHPQIFLKDLQFFLLSNGECPGGMWNYAKKKFIFGAVVSSCRHGMIKVNRLYIRCFYEARLESSLSCNYLGQHTFHNYCYEATFIMDKSALKEIFLDNIRIGIKKQFLKIRGGLCILQCPYVCICA